MHDLLIDSFTHSLTCLFFKGLAMCMPPTTMESLVLSATQETPWWPLEFQESGGRRRQKLFAGFVMREAVRNYLNCALLNNLLVTGSLASMAEIQQSDLSLARWNFRKGISRWLKWSVTVTRASFRIAPTLSICTTLAVGPTLMWCLTQIWVQELFASMIPTDLYLKICL